MPQGYNGKKTRKGGRVGREYQGRIGSKQSWDDFDVGLADSSCREEGEVGRPAANSQEGG